MAYPDVDPRREALYELEKTAQLPPAGAARFLQVIAALMVALSVVLLFSGDVEKLLTAGVGILSACFILSVGSLYQHVFDIRTLMLREAASKESGKPTNTIAGEPDA
jgi:hypothetical protein